MSKSKVATKKTITPCMYDVIESPVITEKSQMGLEQNKASFYVAPCATKGKIKKAVEALFGVDVKKVNIINEKGKQRRFRGRLGKLKDQKKAIVTVAAGQQIDITSTL
jgi:large subunit ribosomal protein L23